MGLALRVSYRALQLTLEALQRHGNRISEPHREALRDSVGLFTAIASGQLRGRYVLDLPTGLGKTTSVVCWAKAMVACGAGWSLAICATGSRSCATSTRR
jgi:CRISPR/Cas system-associated endonuclease/helicase Cas3